MMRPFRLDLALRAATLASVFGLSACERPLTAPDERPSNPAALGDTNAKPSPRFSYAGLASGLLITPVGLDFGNVQIGTTAPSQVVTITNIASVPVVMSGAGGAPPTGQFGGVQSCQGLTLAPDASCQMIFAFSPSAAGSLSDASVGSWNGQ